jgi:hypothetical protein
MSLTMLIECQFLQQHSLKHLLSPLHILRDQFSLYKCVTYPNARKLHVRETEIFHALRIRILGAAGTGVYPWADGKLILLSIARTF